MKANFYTFFIYFSLNPTARYATMRKITKDILISCQREVRMTAKECITGRRSIRKFKADAISHDLLNEIIETASYAPSWKNTQITRYIAVEDPALKAQIAQKATAAHPNNANIINGAPVLMVITLIKNRSGYERDGSFTTSKGDHWQMFDAGVAAQTFCLAAYEKGLGSV